MSLKVLSPISVVGFVLAAPASAFAAAPTGTGTGEDTPLSLPADGARHVASPGSSGSLVRTIVGLAVVIAVIYGVSWVLRQVKGAKDPQVSGAGLQHAASIPLGPNRSLHLVRAGSEVVLVGSAEHGVTPIRTYSEEEAIAIGLIADSEVDDEGPAPSAGPPRAQTLVDRLRDLTTR